MSLPTVVSPDTRNLQWRENNVGARLLEKMGWDGETVGKRKLNRSEGLRVAKRADGLGLGASAVQQVASNDHPVQNFSSILSQLQQEHGKKRKRKLKSKTAAVLPTNKTTCHKVRKAKFREKTADEMKCIFGGHNFVKVGEVDKGDEKERKKRKPKV